MESPYEYYDSKLGVKLNYLTSDRGTDQSLGLISYRALCKRMNSDTRPERRLRRACLNMDALILFSSLPRDWKDAITTKFGDPEREIKRSWFAKHYITDGEARDFYLAHRYGKQNGKKLDLKLIDQYTYNASVLNTVLKVKRNRKEYARAIGNVKIRIWESLSLDVNHFKEVPHNLPTTPGGLRYKANKYAKALKDSQQAAYETLISRKLMNKNASKIDDHAAQKRLIDELISKHTNLDNELIASLYNVVAEKMNWKSIDAMTVFNRKQEKNLVTYAGRNGLKKLKHNILMQAKRKRPSAPLLFWTFDGWDTELLYQKTYIDKKGRRVTTYHNRLTTVFVVDPYNYYIVGYAIGETETSGLIKKALRNALNHMKELFGDRYRPYQIQSDNFGGKALKESLARITEYYTPAEAGNAKAKPIEPFFNRINKQYFRLMDNWSGYGVASGSKNQPNDEFINKIKKAFPDRRGCEQQIISIIAQHRTKHKKEFVEGFQLIQPELKAALADEPYLLAMGQTTGNTNRLTGEGLKIRINREDRYYDSFDINFRHQSHRDWRIFYDDEDLSQVLAVSKDGSERFILQEKYLQPMALADRKPGDAEMLQNIFNFNKQVRQSIIEERAENAEILDEFFNENPALNDTLAKLIITDSRGGHKTHKAEERLKAARTGARIEERQSRKEERQTAREMADAEAEYYAGKIDINEYLNQD